MMATGFGRYGWAVTIPSAGYEITDLGNHGGRSALPLGINEAGHVVGYAAFDVGHDTRYEAVLWRGGESIGLGTLPGHDEAVANDINDLGQIVGMSGSNDYRAFLWQDGVMTNLGTLGGNESRATAINNLGQIVGRSKLASGATHAFLWQDGEMTDLGTLGGDVSLANSINDAGQVVGWSRIGEGDVHHAFLWENGTMTDLGSPAGFYGSPEAINAYGTIVGDYTTALGSWAGCVWQGGTATRVPYSPDDVNDHGIIVGGSRNMGGVPGVVAQGETWHWLDDLIPAGSGWTLHAGRSINNRGQITGAGQFSQGAGIEKHAYLLTPASEDPPGPGKPAKLIAHFTFDNTFGDSTSNELITNPGVFQPPTFNTSDKRFGEAAADFEADTIEHLYVEHDTAFTNLQDVTVAVWLKPESWNGARRIFQKGSDGDFSLRRFGGNGQFRMQTNGKLLDAGDAASLMPPGQWYHVAAVFDTGRDSMRLYIDGQAVGSAPLGGSGIRETTSRLYIGHKIGHQSYGDNFDGLMDEFFIFGEALSVTEIQNLMEYNTTIPEPSSVVLLAIAGVGLLVLACRRGKRGPSRSAAIAAALGLSVGAATAAADTIGLPYADAVLSDDPIGYWRFEETGGTTALDSSGNGRHATYHGAAAPGAPGALPTDANAAVAFPGGTGYVDVGRHAALNQLRNDFTIEAWVLEDAANGSGTVMSTKGSFTSGYALTLNPGELWFTTYGRKDYKVTIPRVLDQWRHFAVAFDASNDAHFYVDGELAGVVAGSRTSGTSSQTFRIGRSPYQSASGQYGQFFGVIDEVAVYGRTLDAGEIREHYFAGVPEPSAVVMLGAGAFVTAAFTWRHRRRAFSTW